MFCIATLSFLFSVSVVLGGDGSRGFNYHGMRIAIATKWNDSELIGRYWCSPEAAITTKETHPMKGTYSTEEEEELRRFIAHGGQYVPECVPLQRVAIIVPYRNRSEHLSLLVANLHLFLIHQKVAEYRLFIVEQTDSHKFNRAKLFNVGFDVARQKWRADVDCFLFHDVEYVPANYSNLYLCATQPRHLTSHYRQMVYPLLFGGIVALSTEQMLRINGFSNRFWGWGGEDDELRMRLDQVNYEVVRLPSSLSYYHTMQHPTRTSNEEASDRENLITETDSTWSVDGLNNLQYRLVAIEKTPLYTKVSVNLDTEQSSVGNFITNILATIASIFNSS